VNSLLFQNKLIGYITGSVQLLIFFLVGVFFNDQTQEHSNMIGWDILNVPTWSVFSKNLAAFLLILLQAFFLDILISSKNIYERSTGLPFLLYTLFMGAHPALRSFSPALVALTFLIASWGIILNMYQQKKAMFASFNVGLLTTIATLFWLPAAVFHLFNIIAAAVIRPVSYKDAIAFIIGGFIPILYISCFYIALPYEFTQYPSLLINNIHDSFSPYRYSPAVWSYASAVFILLNLSLLNFFQNVGRLKIISRRFITICIIVPVFLIAGISLAENPNGSHFSAIAVPFTVLLTQAILALNDERIIKIGLITMFLLILWLQIDWYFEISFSILG